MIAFYGQLGRQDPPVVEARKEAGRAEERYRRAVRRSSALIVASAKAERRQPVLVLEPTEFALHGVARGNPGSLCRGSLERHMDRSRPTSRGD
jgi:hypothetical protein